MRARLILVGVCATLASLSSAARVEAQPPPASGETARADVGSPPPPNAMPTGVDVGTYGRVGVGMALGGHVGYSTNVVSHGSRVEEPPYLELDFYYSRAVGGNPAKRWRIVLTPAFASGDLFHCSGSLDSHFVIRNAY